MQKIWEVLLTKPLRLTQRSTKEREPVKVITQLHLHTKHPNKCKNYSIVQSQWTLVVYKNTKGSNYRSQGVKDSKGNKTNSLGSRGQTKDLSRRRHLSGLHSRTNSIKKELI